MIKFNRKYYLIYDRKYYLIYVPNKCYIYHHYMSAGTRKSRPFGVDDRGKFSPESKFHRNHRK